MHEAAAEHPPPTHNRQLRPAPSPTAHRPHDVSLEPENLAVLQDEPAARGSGWGGHRGRHRVGCQRPGTAHGASTQHRPAAAGLHRCAHRRRHVFRNSPAGTCKATAFRASVHENVLHGRPAAGAAPPPAPPAGRTLLHEPAAALGLPPELHAAGVRVAAQHFVQQLGGLHGCPLPCSTGGEGGRVGTRQLGVAARRRRLQLPAGHRGSAAGPPVAITPRRAAVETCRQSRRGAGAHT